MFSLSALLFGDKQELEIPLSFEIAPSLDLDDEIIVPLDNEVQYTLDGEPIAPNSIVWIQTEWHGLQPGYVYAICDNPYYGQTGLCAYVVSFEGEPFWTDYVTVEVDIS